jgi:hypothetical protein
VDAGVTDQAVEGGGVENGTLRSMRPTVTPAFEVVERGDDVEVGSVAPPRRVCW